MNAHVNSILSLVVTCLVAVSFPSAPWAQTNVRINGADTTVRDTQSETTIVRSGNNVIVGFNNSAVYVPFASPYHFTGWATSTDGGATFVDRGALPGSTNGDAGDPVLAGAGTSVYLATLMSAGSGVQVFRSTDNGLNFGTPVNGAPGFGGGDLLDKEWIAVDPFAGTGQNNVYLAFRNFAGGGSGSRPGGIYFSRSLNGGAVWSNPALLIASGAVQGAYVAVGPDHAVYVFWHDANQTTRRILMRRSLDQGVTFQAAIVVASLTGTGVNGNLGLNGGFRTNSFPQAVVNPYSGNIYVVFNDVGATAGDRADVYFTQSTDGGAHWAPRVRVNDDTTTRDQWQPAIAVLSGGSQLVVGFYDRRLDPANSLIDRYGVFAPISGATVQFLANFRITTQGFPVVIGQDPAVNATYMGDYDQIATDAATFYVPWGDNRNATALHSHQPDVLFSTICRTGYDRCGDSCVYLPNDPNNCGSCQHQCPSIANGFPVCIGGTCGYQCYDGYEDCGYCTDTSSDPWNCGACGDYCPSEYWYCSSGTCTSPPPPPPPSCVLTVSGISCGGSSCADICYFNYGYEHDGCENNQCCCY